MVCASLVKVSVCAGERQMNQVEQMNQMNETRREREREREVERKASGFRSSVFDGQIQSSFVLEEGKRSREKERERRGIEDL